MTVIDAGHAPSTPSGSASVLAVDRPPSVLRQALRMRRTQIGLVVAGAMVAIALFGPYLAPYGAREYVGSPNVRNAPKTRFGTDYFGQDVNICRK